MRLLEPSLGAMDPEDGVIELETKVRAARAQAVECITQDILEKAQKFINPTTAQDITSKLRAIIQKVDHISRSLCAQRCRYGCRPAIKALGGEFMYKTNTEQVEVHESYRKDFDDAETACDGRKIFVSVRPLLLAIGSSDGTDTESERVLRKGVVWMGPAEMFAAQEEDT